MDNLTHSLAGAILGQMGLKRQTGLAMPTLIISANIPDIDAVATLLAGNQHLAIRRGITHGPIALMLLPIMLWAIMLWFDGWQTRRGKRPDKRLPVHKGWLLALAYIGTISHPALDWLNSYGIRLLEPFSSQWFYGDTIFIIDIWIWAALIASVWISLRRERRGRADWQRPAWVGFTVICAYILANGLITGRAEQLTTAAVERQLGVVPTMVVANPVPVQFWKREMLWRNATLYGQGSYTAPSLVTLDATKQSHPMSDPAVRTAIGGYADGKAFLFWARMPITRIEEEGDLRRLVVADQRFGDPRVRDRFAVEIPWKGQAAGERGPP